LFLLSFANSTANIIYISQIILPPNTYITYYLLTASIPSSIIYTYNNANICLNPSFCVISDITYTYI
jgi:hypothetical protein